jgi:hypothetical protein
MNKKKFTTQERLRTLEQAFLVVTQQITKLANQIKKLQDEELQEQ